MNYRELFRQAYQRAEDESGDQSTRNCALLFDPAAGEVIEYGVNRFPVLKLKADARNHERPRKYAFIEHAEREVIYKCARLGKTTKGLIMVCPWACCPDCARAIVTSGIPLVVAHKQAFAKTPERWREPIEHGLEILRAGDVIYHLWDGEIGGHAKNRFDGEYWSP